MGRRILEAEQRPFELRRAQKFRADQPKADHLAPTKALLDALSSSLTLVTGPRQLDTFKDNVGRVSLKSGEAWLLQDGAWYVRSDVGTLTLAFTGPCAVPVSVLSCCSCPMPRDALSRQEKLTETTDGSLLARLCCLCCVRHHRPEAPACGACLS